MAQQIDQWDDSDLMPLAGFRNLLRLFTRQASLVCQFRVAGVLKVVIHPEDEGVHRTRSYFFFDELNEFIDAIGGGRRDAKTAHRQPPVRWILRRWQMQSRGQQQTEQVPGSSHTWRIIVKR